MLHEEWIVLGDLDGEALGVEVELVVGAGAVSLTALDPSSSLPGESEQRCVGDVVVDELPPLHHVVRVQLAGGIHIGNNV